MATPSQNTQNTQKPRSKVGRLVEKVGRMMEYWQGYQRQTWSGQSPEWTDAEYEERKRILLGAMSEMFAELDRRGQTVKAYGWAYTATGDWHRVGETPPVRPRLPIPPDEEDTEFVEVAEDPSLFTDESPEKPALSPWA
jgi:hypothetical protein